MSTHRLPVQPVLSAEETADLDSFCAAHAGVASLPALAEFLQKRFSLELVLDPDIVAGFAKDSSNLPGSAQALARPVTERDAALVMRACHRMGVPLTLSGGRSNLTGSATPEGGVVLSCAGMLTPNVTVDAAAKTAVAPVGMLLEDFRKAVLQASGGALQFPVDPTSRAEAGVGGAISCNASGFTPGETGAFRPWVDSVRFLLPDGTLVDAKRGAYVSANGAFELTRDGKTVSWPVPRYPRPRIKNAGGPYSSPEGTLDFVDLVVGSEGIFGFVTACVVRLAPRSPDYLDLFFSLPDESVALRLLNHVLEKNKGDLKHLSAFEYFGVHCRKYMKHGERFFHGEDQVGIYVQEPLFDRDADSAAEAWLETLAEAECDLPDDAILVLDSDKLRTLFLEARHSMPANALEVVQHRGTYTIMTDTVVPSARFPEMLAFTHGMLESEGLEYLSFGHMGDCHLHFTILPEKAQIEKGVAAYDAIVAKSAELGGVYSGEHGTGKRKRKDFVRCYGDAAVEDLRRVKAAVDPQFLLNRGDVIVPA